MTSTTRFLAVAVLNRIDNRLAIWHVDVGSGTGLSRLPGAWVLDIEQTEEIGVLLNGYHTVNCVTGLELPKGVTTAGPLDIDAMVASVRAEIDSADALFTQHVAGTPKYKQPVRPNWPEVVYPANTLALTQQTEAVIRPVLATAHSLKDLAVTWFEFERLRVARPFLIEHTGPDLRPLPLVVE
ncbi:hypothetical protein ACQPW1_19995 [Nocardia sp. CA-128927]|uniref:hypothetical protein n=1 Tax=Nocardia sp. CA-128927 TaxID=3239975 RepID=UPI003D9634BA